MRNIFYIVDVFALEKYSGNQLAVVKLHQKLTGDEMLKIASDMNFSETSFITSEKPENEGYNVRIFTPKVEVPFAGHPILGTAYVIQNEILKEDSKRVILNLKVGQIPVDFFYVNGKIIMLKMKQKSPRFGKTFDMREIAEILNLTDEDIDRRFPIQEVSTGIWFLIVPLVSLKSVKRAKLNQDKYYKFIENINAKGILVFSPETYKIENDLNVRVFVHYYGVPEDPATGSGNGCLAGYLVQNRYFDKEKIDISVEQGYEINRHSQIKLQAEYRLGKIDVYVGGRVIMIARGELL